MFPCLTFLLRSFLVPNQGQDRDGICRSWGQHHYETFDGIYFYFPGTCSYILAQDCHSSTPQYTVWVRASNRVFSCFLKTNKTTEINSISVLENNSCYSFIIINKKKYLRTGVFNVPNIENRPYMNGNAWIFPVCSLCVFLFIFFILVFTAVPRFLPPAGNIWHSLLNNCTVLIAFVIQ